MDPGDQIRAFARAYKEKGKDLDMELMERLYPDIKVHYCYNFLRSCNKHAPANMNGYSWKLRKLAQVYFSLP